MTQEELNRMLERDGLYIIGNRSYPHLSQPVLVMDAGKPSAGLFAMEACHRLLPCDSDWPKGAYLSSGPHGVQADAALDQKAQDVKEEVLRLDHDLAFWRQMGLECLNYMYLLSVCSTSMEIRRGACAMHQRLQSALAAGEPQPVEQ